jgi:hypothetical protein
MAKTSKSASEVKTQANHVGRKKNESSKTKNSKQSKNNRPGRSLNQAAVRSLEAGDTRSYLLLRQALDSFQAVALFYYGGGEDSQQRVERAEEIKEYLGSFNQQTVQALSPDGNCPPGTRSCSGGDCVPVYIGCFEGG